MQRGGPPNPNIKTLDSLILAYYVYCTTPKSPVSLYEAYLSYIKEQGFPRNTQDQNLMVLFPNFDILRAANK